MILPFWWITLMPWDDSNADFLEKYNLFLCHLLYLPLAFGFMIFFTIQNILYMPAAYAKHTLILI